MADPGAVLDAVDQDDCQTRLGYAAGERNFRRAVLGSRTYVWTASLDLAQLEGIDLSEADLSGLSMGSINLCGANLHKARLACAFLMTAELRDVNLSEADLTMADVQATDLRRANLRGAILRDTMLSMADLREADLTGADVQGADLKGALLAGAIMPDGTIHSNQPELARRILRRFAICMTVGLVLGWLFPLTLLLFPERPRDHPLGFVQTVWAGIGMAGGAGLAFVSALFLPSD